VGVVPSVALEHLHTDVQMALGFQLESTMTKSSVVSSQIIFGYLNTVKDMGGKALQKEIVKNAILAAESIMAGVITYLVVMEKVLGASAHKVVIKITVTSVLGASLVESRKHR